eukprot:TRINITY_DN1354_c0_g1_i1.p1 TRINITY_DN1354_c0_g1~~TRINITY_DN1354_c0_g1_i1.p1  ORF type:complete len:712 (+),score=165.51 TRINITY_DN1354_c0_g1_i1:147-2282(+)
MYSSLSFVSNMNFALNVAENIYAKAKLDDEEFVSSQAALYYANKRNILGVEMLESIYQVFSREKCGISDQLTSISGTIEKIGNKYAIEVLLFTPTETTNMLEEKLLKIWQVECREQFHQIAEGEFVLLLSYYPNEVTQDMENQVYNNVTLAGFLNSMSRVVASANVETRNIYNLLSECGLKIEQAMIAGVKEITRDMQIKLFALPTRDQHKCLSQSGRLWKIFKLTNRNHNAMACAALEDAVSKPNMSNLMLQLILNPPGDMKRGGIQELAETKATVESKPYFVNNSLNQNQARAIQAASTQLVTLIQGPPGSGKTTLAVEIILEWLRQSPTPVLACANNFTNMDRLHNELVKAGLKVIKLGPMNDPKAGAFTDMRFKYYQQFFNQKKFNPVANQKHQMIKKTLADAQVVVSTPVGCATEFMRGLKYTRVLIDEAAQMTETDALFAISKQCQQLVLLGDHKLYSPSALSGFAQSKGMCVSLFERLIRQGVKPILLNIQYRLHSSLTNFPSQHYYNGLLQTGISDDSRPPLQGFPWPNPNLRLAFIHVKGDEQIYSASVQNLKEVELTTRIIMQFLRHGSIRVSQIGVVTPYDAQNRRIRAEILNQARKLPNLFGLGVDDIQMLNKFLLLVEVDTLDRFASKDKDLIIFSAVRSNKSSQLGFLREPNKINCAITRAKRGIVMIGDVDTLTVDPNWREFFLWARSNGVLMTLR